MSLTRSHGAVTEAFGHDAGSHAKGRLSSFTDATGSTVCACAADGRLSSQTRTIAGQA